MKYKLKQELQDLIAAHDVAMYALQRIKNRPDSFKIACSKLSNRLFRDQRALINRFNKAQPEGAD